MRAEWPLVSWTLSPQCRRWRKPPLRLVADTSPCQQRAARGPGPLMDYILGRSEAIVKLSGQIKPISYLKAHAAEIVRTLGAHGGTLVITQNGEAKVVVQDIDSYEQTQGSMALLKVLALGNRQISASKVRSAAEVFARLHKR